MGRHRLEGGGGGVKFDVAPGRAIHFLPEQETVDALNAFLQSNGYSLSEGMRILIRTALSSDARTISSEFARNKAYRDTEEWVRERVAANFREIAALLEQQVKEIRALPPEGG